MSLREGFAVVHFKQPLFPSSLEISFVRCRKWKIKVALASVSVSARVTLLKRHERDHDLNSFNKIVKKPYFCLNAISAV